MSHRIGLSMLTFVLAGSFAVADTLSANDACTVGDVKPVLSLPSNDGFADAYFEGVAVGEDGSIYSVEACTGDVYRIRPDGEWKVIATIPYGVVNDYYCNNANALGLAISEDGDVWVVVISWVEESHGIWRIHRNGMAELAVPLSPVDVPFPNAIAFDQDGNLYITESFTGSIWKARPGDPATLWLRDKLLAPSGNGIGANGIAYGLGALYVANSDRGSVVRVPLTGDGSAGRPLVFASGINGPDGMTINAFGDPYLVTYLGGQLVRVRPDHQSEIVLDLVAAGVAYPTSIDFGKLFREMNTAYIANFIRNPGEPNLVKVNLCQRHSR